MKTNVKSTKEEFIEKSKNIFGDLYDYSKVEYFTNKIKVELICEKHGSFFITPNRHTSKKSGCPKCGRMNMVEKQKSKTWLDDFKNQYGDKYDYSKVEYINRKTKVEIICKEHGSFWQTPNTHIWVGGCPKCGKMNMIEKKKSKTWLDNFKRVHGNRYDYSKVEYKNIHTKVEIICKEHGSFWQTPYSHTRYDNSGCGYCTKDYLRYKFNDKKWLNKFIKIHGYEYDYSKVEYKNTHTKVEIVCKDHGSFWQTPYNHYKKNQHCPNCNISKGERRIVKHLVDNNISYIRSHIFNECRDIKPLRFDFYLPDHNLCIEYDGEQHFRSVEWFGGDENFKKQQNRDYIKDMYCLDNKISLIRISYLEYNDIESILSFLN